MEKLQGYCGDVDLRHGGYFWRMDSAESDYADIVRVTPASDMGGPDNMFFIETGSLYLPGDEREDSALESCGIDTSASVSPWARVDSMLHYWGLDSRSETVVQVGARDEFYSEGRGFSMPVVDRFLGERTNLKGFIQSEFVDWPFAA